MQGETIKRAGSRRLGPVDIAVSDRDRERAFKRARRHSVLVKLMKVVLPSIAAISVGYYAMALVASSALKGSNITVGKVTIDPSNLQMADPRYSGFGKDGSEYRVHAKSAVTDLRTSAPIKLNVIDGQITQPNGVVTSLKAKWGTYDQKKELLELYEKIDVDATNGMIARLTRATVFTKESRILSDEPIYAETATGRIRAHSMTLNTKTRTAQFRDDVTVTLKPTQPVGTQNENDAKKKRDAQAFGIDTSSNEPVIVTSRRLDVDDNARTALFRDDVIARQGEASLAAPELDVLYEGRADPGGKAPAASAAPGDPQASKLKSLHARGGVVMINKVDRAESQTLDYDALAERIILGGDVVMTQAPDRRVTAQTVVFEQKEDTALLTGEVVVTQARNVLRGESLAIDRKVGTARLSSPAQGDEPAGRIFTLLYQSQADKPGAAKAKAKVKNPPDEEQPAALGALGANFKSDPNAPIDVEAQTLDVNDREHVAIYTGSVVAKQGTFVVKTEEMTAHYQGNMGLLGGAQPETAQPPHGAKGSGTGPGGSQLKRIEARHGVVVTGADDQKATGEWADFDVAQNTIVMGGNVMVSQGKQIVRAPAGMRLVIDLTTGVTRFEPEPGMAAKAGPKVSGAFSTSVSPAAPGMPGCPPGAVCKSGRLEAIFYPNQMKEKTDKGSGAKADRHHKAPQTGSAWTSTTRPSGTP
jgi:lipopolysaccharide export system protein LptA